VVKVSRPILLLLLGSVCAGSPGCFRSEVMAPDRAVVLWQQVNARQSAPGMKPAAGKEPSQLGLEEALQLALKDNPSLKVLEARLAQSQAEEGEAIQLDNPQLRINNIEVDKIAESRPELDLALRVPIPKPWILDARTRRAELATEETRARLARGRAALRLEVRRLFISLATLEQEQRELALSLDKLGKHVTQVEQKLAAGAATRFDHSTAKLRVAEVDDRLGAVRSNHGETVLRLRRLVGVRPARPVTFKTEKLAEAPADLALDDQALIKKALQNQPDLREAAARVGMAQADAYIARAQRWPWLRYAEVSYGFNPNMDPLNLEFSVAVSVPLLSWNQGSIEAGDALVTRRRLEEQARLMAVAQDVSQACENVRIMTARLREMERTLLPAVKDTGAALAEAATRGAIDPLDAIQVETRRIRARRRYLRALREHKEALVRLDAAVGAEQSK